MQRRAGWIAAAIAIVAYYPRFIKGNGSAVFSAAADCMLRGEAPLHCKTVIFAYPPFFALLSIPFAVMPAWLREAVWYLVLIGTLGFAQQLCETLARRLFPGAWTERELIQLRILTFVLSLKFILAVLENQAYDSIALVLILLGLLALASERSILAGVSLAVAAAIKVTPLIFLPYLVFKRRFAAAAVFVAVVVCLTLLPDILLPPKTGWHVKSWGLEVLLGPLFYEPPVDLPFWVTDSPMNQSIRGAIIRLISGIPEQQTFEAVLAIMRTPAFKLASYGAMGLYVLGVGFLLLKSLRHRTLIAVDGALLIVSMLLLSPVSSQSHFVALMLPYSILAAALIKDRATGLSNTVVLSLSFVLLTATSNDLVGRSFTGWALWNSLPVLGTLILVAQLAVVIWSAGGNERNAAPAVAEGRGQNPDGISSKLQRTPTRT